MENLCVIEDIVDTSTVTAWDK